MTTYSEKLRDPRWQKKRLEIMQRDGWACVSCLNSNATLVVHHKYYERDKDPWDYPDEALVTLCEFCHDGEARDIRDGTEQDLLAIVKTRLLMSDLIALYEALCSDGYQNLIKAARDIAYKPMFDSFEKDTNRG